jgi:hypothetical protein
LAVKWSYQNGLLVMETVGDYTIDELKVAIAEAAADPGFKPGASVLIDSRESAVQALGPSDVEQRISLIASLPVRGFSPRCALVVRTEPVRFGVGRQLQMHVESRGVKLHVGYDLPAALAWLGAP